MSRRQQAVLTVDAVEGWMGGPAVDRAAEVVATARERGALVLHTRLRFRADGIDGGHYLRRNRDVRRFAGVDVPFCAGLAPRLEELVIPRSYPSPFFATSLAATLRGAGISGVTIVGATTSGAIRAASLDAMQHGFDALVVRDAVCDPSGTAHTQALAEIETHWADLTDTAAVGAALTPAHP